MLPHADTLHRDGFKLQMLANNKAVAMDVGHHIWQPHESRIFDEGWLQGSGKDWPQSEITIFGPAERSAGPKASQLVSRGAHCRQHENDVVGATLIDKIQNVLFVGSLFGLCALANTRDVQISDHHPNEDSCERIEKFSMLSL